MASIICSLIGHDFGDWERIIETYDYDPCKAQRSCRRCSTTEYRKQSGHDWAEWQGDSCVENRTCRACGKHEDQERHQWAAWAYVDNHSCDQEIRCLRCGRVSDRRSDAHDWDWQYVAEGRCEQKAACKRCHAQSSQAQKTHQWGGMSYRNSESCDGQRVCVRCRESDPVIAQYHQWSAPYRPDRRCDMVRRCKRCGNTEVVRRATDQDHVWNIIETDYDRGDGTVLGWLMKCSFCGAEKTDRNEHHW